MRLHEFIAANMEAILKEWEEFARANQPTNGLMDIADLRDHAHDMLQVIMADMCTTQTETERTEKSHGNNPASETDTAAESHATERLQSGFSISVMAAEYRALRASVLRLWRCESGSREEDAMEDMIRFNEAIDQALAESVSRYCDALIKNSDIFIGMLGHDLRGPLQYINLAASRLGQIKYPDRSLADMGANIQDSAERMKGMLDDLMDFTESRIGGGMVIARQEMDMGNVCSQVVAELQAMHPDSVIRLATTGECIGSWDAGRIAQICQNLIINAVQHGAKDGDIEVSCEARDSEAVLSVHNNGEPIPDVLQSQIFELSERGGPRQSNANKNLGLGLYIVRELTFAHNGEVSVTSDKDHGTTFRVVLPRDLSPDAVPAS